MKSPASLKRVVTLPLLTLYGLGTIIGAGIYVLIGEVAKEAGMFAPVSFLVAAIIAAFTAFTYAELSSRFPKSAGEAYYAQTAFNRRWLAALLGWSVVTIGIVSSAAITVGFDGYFQVFVESPSWLVISLMVLSISMIAAWGIGEAVWFAAIVTLIEVGGLIFVLAVSGDLIIESSTNIAELIPSMDQFVWSGIFLGAFLAFYAFIGFEDMVNIAEEVKDPQSTLPKSILLVILISTLLYAMVAIVAVVALPPEQLGESSAPLRDIVVQSSESGGTIISLISLIAVVNGALIQVIMASRVLYGMAEQGIAPKLFAEVSTKTRTPLWATFAVAAIVLILALGFSIVTLAKVTSFITLLIFAAMHIVLIRTKRLDPLPVNATIYPVWIPIFGLMLISALVIFQCWYWLMQ